MRLRPIVAVTAALAVAALAVASPASAQAPAQPTASAPAPSAGAAVTERAEEPSVDERRIVAFVASGVTVASLATGITMGVLAQQQFACAADIVACNKTLDDPVVGAELLDVRAEVEQKALFADMAFLFAGAAAVVATVGFLRGFVFVDEPAAPVAAVVPAGLPASAAEAVATAPTTPTIALGASR
jgi:hypothetical protein